MSIETPQTRTHADQAREYLTDKNDTMWRSKTGTPNEGRSERGLQVRQTDATIATAHALLAVRDELAAMRAETADQRGALWMQVAGVCGELATIAAALQDRSGTQPVEPLVSTLDVVNGLADVAAVVRELTDQMAGIAVAVESLTAAVDEQRQQQRRRWWSRRAEGGR